jgi:hypothetical protein
MKESFSLEIISTKSALSNNQQADVRGRLKQLLKNEGIISICLDESSIFIEYKPDVLDKALPANLLLDYNFPLDEFMIESIVDTIVV